MPIKDHLIKSIFKFAFEIEVGFENIDNSVKTNLNKFVKEIEKESVFESWVETEYKNLSLYSDKLKTVCDKMKRNEKIQNNEFDFLNEMIVFNDILELKNFKDENRSTKKDICVLMYNVYKTLQIIKKGMDYKLSEEELDDLYNKCVVKVVEPKIVEKKVEQRQLQPQASGSNVLQNLVTDMLGEFQRGELNPMELLQDIMKGPENITKEGTSINKFTKKYEQRLTDDKVKKEIETQFGSIFKNFTKN